MEAAGTGARECPILVTKLRGLVDHVFTSWNPLISWLRRVNGRRETHRTTVSREGDGGHGNARGGDCSWFRAFASSDPAPAAIVQAAQ
jgi:hypothetical protein